MTIEERINQIRSFWEILNIELFSGKLKQVDFAIQNIARDDCIALKVERRDIFGVYLSEKERVFAFGEQRRPMIVLSDYTIDFANRAESNGAPENGNAKIVSELLHEMVHQYCVENYIKDIKKREKHTKEFIIEAKKRGSIFGSTELSTELSSSHESLWYAMNLNYDFSERYYHWG